MDNHKPEREKKFVSLFGPSDLLGLLSAVAGCAVGLFPFIKNPILAAVAIVTSQIILLFGWAYILWYRYKSRKALMLKDTDISALEEKVKNTQAELEAEHVNLQIEREDIRKQLFIISNEVKSNNIHSTDILVKIPSETSEQYELLDRLQSIMQETSPDPDTVDKIREDVQKSAKKYAVDLFDIFNRYCRDATDEALKLQNAYLKLKNVPLKVSMTIKLMDRPYHPDKDIVGDIKVYTAFRDHEAYSAHEREIGERLYTVNGNTAFIQCTTKSYSG